MLMMVMMVMRMKIMILLVMPHYLKQSNYYWKFEWME
jgi:hypothetical protein